MVLPKYIQTEWYGEGKAVLELKNQTEDDTSDKILDQSIKPGKITCYISSVYIREYEEIPTKPACEDPPSTEDASSVHIESRPTDSNSLICPPDVTPEIWQSWIVYWEAWKEIYIPLAWIQKHRDHCMPSFIEWHDTYISENPWVVPLIKDGLHEEMDDQSSKLVQEEKKNEDDVPPSEGEDSGKEWDKLYEEFSSRRYWIHLRSFLQNNNLQPSQDLIDFFAEHGHVDFIEGSVKDDSHMPDVTEDSSPTTENFDSEVNNERSEQCVTDENSSSSHLVEKEGTSDEKTNTSIIESIEDQNNDDPDKIGVKRRQTDITDGDGQSEESEIEIRKKARHTLADINGLNSSNKPLQIGEQSPVDSQEVDCDTDPENKENLPCMKSDSSKSKQKSSKFKKKHQHIPSTKRSGGLGWAMKYFDKNEENTLTNDQSEAREDGNDSPGETTDVSNIFSVSAASHAVTNQGNGLSSLGNLPSVDYQFSADELNLKGDLRKLSECFDAEPAENVCDNVDHSHNGDKVELTENVELADNESDKVRSFENSDSVEPTENVKVSELSENVSGSANLSQNVQDEVCDESESSDESLANADEDIGNDDGCESCDESRKMDHHIKADSVADKKEAVALPDKNKLPWSLVGSMLSLKNVIVMFTTHMFGVIFPSFKGSSGSIVRSLYGSFSILDRVIRFFRSKEEPEEEPCVKIKKPVYHIKLEKWLQQKSPTNICPPGSYPFSGFKTLNDTRDPKMIYQSIRTEMMNDGTLYVQVDALDLEDSSESEDQDSNVEQDWQRTHVTFDDDGNPVEVSKTEGTYENDHEWDDPITTAWNDIVANHRLMSYKNEKDAMPSDLPEHLHKYWSQRHRLFLRYDEGIKLDEESWYSVTPEMIAAHHAYRCRSNVVVDAFCGSGGNAIQLASTCNRVIAIDVDPAKIELAIHNAKVYGVEDRIQFIVGDFFKVAPTLKASAVLLSPPWGGTEYLQDKVYDVKNLGGLDCQKIMDAARRISKNIALYLPRSSDLFQVIELAGREGTVDIEYNYMGNKRKALTAYFGKLACY